MNELALRRQILARRHHLVGWVGLFCFLGLGSALETFHGFKLGFYLDPAHRLRRELWTLAHAHGTLIALIHLAYAVSLPSLGVWTLGRLNATSFFLLGALCLMPLGFFLGGLWPGEGDPWIGVLLVPVGAAFLLAGVGLSAWSAWAHPAAAPAGDAKEP